MERISKIFDKTKMLINQYYPLIPSFQLFLKDIFIPFFTSYLEFSNPNDCRFSTDTKNGLTILKL